MRTKPMFWLVVLLCMATALFGCGSKTEVNQAAHEAGGSASAANDAAEMTTVTLGLAKFTSNAPLYIALEKGFFHEENLNVDLKWFEAANPLNVAVASNNLDVGGAGSSADLYNMIAAGQKVVFVADKGREEKGYPYSALLVSHDSPIQSIADLKGKKVGITTIGSTNHYSIGRIMEKHGLSTNDVQWVPMNSVKSVLDALKGKQVDVAFASEPNVSSAVKAGYAKILTKVADEIDFQSSGIIFSPTFVNNKDAGVRFLKAYLKGARYYYDAVLKQQDGQLVKGANYDEVAQIVSEYTGVPEDLVKESFTFVDPNGKLKVDDIKTQIDWYAKEKLVTDVLDTKEIVNVELLEAALREMGEYQP